MKRVFSAAVLLLLLTVLCSFTCLADSNENDITLSADSVLTSRLENMLDHNYLYDNDFYDMHTVINNSCLALLHHENENYISTDVLFPFIDSMYAIPVYCDDTLNLQFERKEGAVYIVPRCYTSYSHTVTDIVNNEGVLTVTSISTDKQMNETATCVTVFAENSESAFGYNIIASTLYNE